MVDNSELEGADYEETSPSSSSFPTDRAWTRQVRGVLAQMEGSVDGMLRVTELFEARRPRGQAIVSPWEGVVAAIEQEGLRRVVIHIESDVDEELVGETLGEDAFVGMAEARRGTTLPDYWPAGTVLTAKHVGRLRDADLGVVIVRKSLLVPGRGGLAVEIGDFVRVGDRITTGPLDPHAILAAQGPTAVMEYLVREIQAVYKMQGVDIHDKHIEVIARQMLRKCRVTSPGDTDFQPGMIVDRLELAEANQAIRGRSA